MPRNYRLCTQDVRDGYTDFNDEVYHLLDEKIVDQRVIGLIYKECHGFIVAWGLHFEVMNSICWDQGHYYQELANAYEKYQSYKEDRRA